MARGGYVSLDDLDDDLFGEPHQGTLSYLREKASRHSSRMTEHFDGFFEDTRDLFERYNGDRALRRIRARVRKVADVFSKDVIRPLRTMGDIQRAKPQMQRYIMSNVMARIAYGEQRIDGYSDSYRNDSTHRIGHRDPDFMRAIDGIIFDEDRHGVDSSTDDNSWVAYQDLNDSEERDLDIIEQSDILSTWDVLEAFLRSKGNDPTSILNEKM